MPAMNALSESRTWVALFSGPPYSTCMTGLPYCDWMACMLVRTPGTLPPWAYDDRPVMSHWPPLALYALRKFCTLARFCGWARCTRVGVDGNTCLTMSCAAISRPVIWAGLLMLPVGLQMPELVSLPIFTQAGVTLLYLKTFMAWY